MSYERHALRLMNKYPAIADLEKRAKRRIPFVSWEYLESGTGDEKALFRNREALDAITFLPQFARGSQAFDISTTLFDRKYEAPFGVAPVGLTGLMWPKAEHILAKMSNKKKIPFCLSTVATQIPESVGQHIGDMGWFQLYPPKDPGLRENLLTRAKENGFHTLVLTADVPAPSRRERTKRAGLKTPPKITPRFIWQGITHPAWSIATLRTGLPRLRTVESYSEEKDMASVEEFVRFKFRGDLGWDYVQEVRDLWDGPMIMKGLLHPSDVEKAISIGVNGVGISNHGGRQFDGAPASIQVLPEIVRIAKGKVAIIFDSGLRTGLDIIRALALGADFVLLGRAFLYGVAALGKYGAEHAATILMEDLKNNMAQLGVGSIKELQELRPFQAT